VRKEEIVQATLVMLLVLGQNISPQNVQNMTGPNLVAKLDQMVSKAGIQWGTPSTADQVSLCLETIDKSGLLGNPTSTTAIIESVTTETSGNIIITGHFRTRVKPLTNYRSKDELRQLADFNEDNKRIAEDYSARLLDIDNFWKRHKGPLPAYVVAHKAAIRREYERIKSDRRIELAEMSKKFNENAQARKDYCEKVSIRVQIPTNITSYNIANLARAKSAKLVFIPNEVALQGPEPETKLSQGVQLISGVLDS
jgi:hypothetical protein